MKLMWFFTFSFVGIIAFVPTITQAGTMAERTAGRVLLQVEQGGLLWYVNPTDQMDYSVSPDTVMDLIRYVGLGISDANLAKIPKAHDTWTGDSGVLNHVRGKIVLQVEQVGQAWYINPANNKRYSLGNRDRAWRVLRKFSLGISDANISKLVAGDFTNPNLPASVSLPVPFTTQAPTGDWSAPYSEACEEAILVMVSHYYSNVGLTATAARDEILSIVNWELAQYGHHEDTSAVETANTLQQYAGLAVAQSSDVSIERLKKLLAAGHPIVVPVDGKLLYNPHYRNGGPYYHMIVLVGYDGNDFITHDPGTHYGDDYRYNMDTLYNAIHDLTNPESNAANGAKTVLVLKTR